MNGNGNGNGQTISWPASVVAGMIVLLLGSITVAAILRYESPEDALKIWAALSGVVGLLTGAFVTYFFTQGTVQEAKDARAAVQEKAEVRAEAFAATAGRLSPNELNNLADSNPAVRKALGM